jgi:dTDP-4-dehydrorhamnose reductase
MMETILVTGATGLLGTDLVLHLKKYDYKVITHSLSRHADILFDLSDRSKSYEILEKINPSVIINLVSLTSVELCEEKVNLAYLANTLSVENLVNWISRSGADCHLVQISTDHIYDGPGLHTEEQITITNNYGFSKYAGELAAIQVPSTILRTNFVGRSKVSHRESLTDWVYYSLTEKKHVQAFNDVYFSPISMKILSEMIELVVQKKPIGIYNLGSHNGMSKADFDFAFAEYLKLPTDTMKRINLNQQTFLKANRPKNMLMDSSKFENELSLKLPDLLDLIPPLALEYCEIN